MCHRFIPLSSEEVREALESMASTGRATLSSETAPAASDAWPGSTVPAILSEGGLLRTEGLVWGFPPPESAQNRSKLVFNTRIETALEQASSGRGMWADAIRCGRCVVATRGFFEPGPCSGADALFKLPGNTVFLLAALQERGRLSIVTTEANRYVSPFHNRMPLALRRGESSTWFGPSFGTLADRSDVDLVVES